MELTYADLENGVRKIDLKGRFDIEGATAHLQVDTLPPAARSAASIWASIKRRLAIARSHLCRIWACTGIGKVDLS